jgi:AP-2 complex subunit alpha
LLCYKALLSPSHVHPSTVRVASHVLGEFGYLLVESPTSGGELDHDVLPIDLFGAVHRHFQIADPATRAIMLTAYSKLLNLYAVLDEPIEEVFELVKRSGDAEVQQRAVEYARVARLQPAVMNYLLEPMPPWPHDRQSPLLRRLAQAEAAGVRSVRSAAASQNPTATAAAKLPLPAPAAAAASASAAEEDAHSSDDEARGKAAAPADSTSDARPLLAAASAAVASDLDRLFLNAMLIPKSLLYQDACIQVGSQQAFALGRGSMQLFVGNRSDAPLSQVFVELDLPAGTAAKLRVVQKSAVDEALPARAQATVEFELECMGPFHVVRLGVASEFPLWALKLTCPLAATRASRPRRCASATWPPTRTRPR